ncbi:hybrid sensor histidine kinase/response regulator [Stenotrophomonas sp. Iso1]|uniref:Hpt domain-containing response regulator n=1 Tax=Stenotrophomonas sp. Iso1 TaxID=2977283 RepID=UPI0022B7BCEA|nr:hybrid sensor histidine kinase/response regulator [Stenotrophomonas sp. Iso1]
MNTHVQGSVPHLLLVEDDMTSQGFFQFALESLPATVDIADSFASALQRAESSHYDLWLIDVNLPDGDGPTLLQRLRAKYPRVSALAHTADASTEIQQALQQAGFSETLIKPMTRDTLLKAIRRTLAKSAAASDSRDETEVPHWDEAVALTALNGQQAHLRALRELFLAELPVARDAVGRALDRHDEPELRNQLHRLQASCGFVGALKLARSVRQLHNNPSSTTARQHFDTAVSALLG